jgi:peptidoglycan hydrolase-like protein with peptidoglycan-binding domain
MNEKNGLPAVKELQTMLNKYFEEKAKADGEKFQPIKVDGKFGNDTRDLLKDFQEDKGLQFLDGKLGPETSDAIQSDANLQQILQESSENFVAAAPQAAAQVAPPQPTTIAGADRLAENDTANGIRQDIDQLGGLIYHYDNTNDPANKSELGDQISELSGSLPGRIAQIKDPSTRESLNRELDKTAGAPAEQNSADDVVVAQGSSKSLSSGNNTGNNDQIAEELPTYDNWVKEIAGYIKENFEKAKDAISNAANNLAQYMGNPEDPDINEQTLENYIRDTLQSQNIPKEEIDKAVGDVLTDYRSRLNNGQDPDNAMIDASLPYEPDPGGSEEDPGGAKKDSKDNSPGPADKIADMFSRASDEESEKDPSKEGGTDSFEDRYYWECKDVGLPCERKPVKVVTRCTPGKCTDVVMDKGEEGNSAPLKSTVVTPGSEAPAKKRILAKDNDVVYVESTGKTVLKAGAGKEVGPENANDIVGTPPQYK